MLTTVSMTVNYLSVAPGEDIVAEGVCTPRGRSLNFAQVVVTSESGKRLAEGMLTVNIAATDRALPEAVTKGSFGKFKVFIPNGPVVTPGRALAVHSPAERVSVQPVLHVRGVVAAHAAGDDDQDVPRIPAG